MKLFHGTGSYALDGFLAEPPIMKPRLYLPRNQKAFCTTTDFKTAELFAFRRSTQEEFQSGKCGIVLEFELFGQEGSDFLSACDNRSLQEESEVAIISLSKLHLIAVWRFEQSWKRENIHGKAQTHHPDKTWRIRRKRKSRDLQGQT